MNLFFWKKKPIQQRLESHRDSVNEIYIPTKTKDDFDWIASVLYQTDGTPISLNRNRISPYVGPGSKPLNKLERSILYDPQKKREWVESQKKFGAKFALKR